MLTQGIQSGYYTRNILLSKGNSASLPESNHRNFKFLWIWWGAHNCGQHWGCQRVAIQCLPPKKSCPYQRLFCPFQVFMSHRIRSSSADDPAIHDPGRIQQMHTVSLDTYNFGSEKAELRCLLDLSC